MKKLFILATLFAGLVSLNSCDADRDSNPIYQQPTEFKLNTPALAANNLFDLENATNVEFTCSQPNYGFTASTNYTLDVSLANDFTEGKFKTLATVYQSAKMNVSANELAVAVATLLNRSEEEFPIQTPVYVRAKAEISGVESSVIYSNVIELPKVLAYFALPPVELPTQLYMIGSMNGWDWANAYAMVPVHSNPDLFWRMVYIPADGEFKFNAAKEWDGGQFGAGAAVKDLAGASVSGSDNLKVSKGGWYLVVVRAAAAGAKLAYTLYMLEPKVWLFGDANGGNWAYTDEGLFSVPETADGDFVSPAFTGATGDGGIRACIDINVDDISGVDWWKTEFIVLGGKLEYRGTGGDQERAAGKAGQKLYINFTNGTGKIE